MERKTNEAAEEAVKVNSVDALQERMKELRKAQKIYAAYSQEQVDKIFFAAAMAANKARIPLAKMAVQETGMGVVEDKEKQKTDRKKLCRVDRKSVV